MKATAEMTKRTKLVEDRLAELLPAAGVSPSPLHEAMRYSALAPGKRLRPHLVMASCGAVGADPGLALDLACAVELIHCFSLIHDDLPSIDNDELRRGRPTCHVQFGEGLALLAGDALFALAFSLAARCAPDGALCAEIVSRLALASGSDGLVGGEVLDILAEGSKEGLDALKVIHQKKTGALIAASCTCGGLVGGASSFQVDLLRQFGEAIGLAFQIHDDILNETSSAEELGKAVGSDRERQKLTYPALLGLERSKELAHEAIEASLRLIDVEELCGTELRDLALFSVQRSS